MLANSNCKMNTLFITLLIAFFCNDSKGAPTNCRTDVDCPQPNYSCAEIVGFRCSCAPYLPNMTQCTSARYGIRDILDKMPKFIEDRLNALSSKDETGTYVITKAKAEPIDVAAIALASVTIVGSLSVLMCFFAACTAAGGLTYYYWSLRKKF